MAVTRPWRYPIGTVFVSSTRASLLFALLTAVPSTHYRKLRITRNDPSMNHLIRRQGSNDCGIVMPSALEAFELMTSSSFVGDSNGRSRQAT